MLFSKQGRLPTGNDAVSIPSLNAATAAAPDINFLSMKHRGLVEFYSPKNAPFFRPVIKVAGKTLNPEKAKDLFADRLEHWVPVFRLSDKKAYDVEWRVLAPLGQRGFMIEFLVNNKTSKTLKTYLGAEGSWSGCRVRNNEHYELRFWRRAEQFGGLAAKHVVLSAGGEMPEYSVALGASDDLDCMEIGLGSIPKAGSKTKWDAKKLKALEASYDSPKTGAIKGGAKAGPEKSKPLTYSVGKYVEVAPKTIGRFAVYFGLGLEPVSAAATCVELRRQGIEALSGSTLKFLGRRNKSTGDDRLDALMNLNLWFNYYYAMGVTLDSEEFVCLTSRSPHYYVNGAYWDRDSMLWSFPAVLAVDPGRARKMLEYAFGRQGGNIGVHSRFITGATLEPGFELDELCAPVIALAAYVKSTGDQSLLKDSQVKRMLRQVEKTLAAKRHPLYALYETTSGPDDDFEPMPYLTYNNVLVWKLQHCLAELKPKLGRDNDVAGHKRLADDIKSDIWRNLVAEGPKGKMFTWASDLRGNKRFYTSPPGCLQLIPYYGFCETSEPAYKNTVAWLHSKDFPYSFHGQPFAELGCAHSTQPWTLGLCNRLLSGQKDKVAPLLAKLSFDDGVACEAFDSKSGKPYSGMAFATCAGLLGYSIWKAFGKSKNESRDKLDKQQTLSPALAGK